MRKIETVRDLVECLRLGSFTSVGCYPLVFVTADGMVLPSAVRVDVWAQARAVRDREHDRVVAFDVYWEGPIQQCALTGEDIESAYGDPYAENDTDE